MDLAPSLHVCLKFCSVVNGPPSVEDGTVVKRHTVGPVRTESLNFKHPKKVRTMFCENLHYHAQNHEIY